MRFHVSYENLHRDTKITERHARYYGTSLKRCRPSFPVLFVLGQGYWTGVHDLFWHSLMSSGIYISVRPVGDPNTHLLPSCQRREKAIENIFKYPFTYISRPMLDLSCTFCMGIPYNRYLILKCIVQRELTQYKKSLRYFEILRILFCNLTCISPSLKASRIRNNRNVIIEKSRWSEEASEDRGIHSTKWHSPCGQRDTDLSRNIWDVECQHKLALNLTYQKKKKTWVICRENWSAEISPEHTVETWTLETFYTSTTKENKQKHKPIIRLIEHHHNSLCTNRTDFPDTKSTRPHAPGSPWITSKRVLPSLDLNANPSLDPLLSLAFWTIGIRRLAKNISAVWIVELSLI